MSHVDTIPLCSGCRVERTYARLGEALVVEALHDERCNCYVIVPQRPRESALHVHPPDESRPWAYRYRP